jgi:hypothetical protein
MLGGVLGSLPPWQPASAQGAKSARASSQDGGSGVTTSPFGPEAVKKLYRKS